MSNNENGLMKKTKKELVEIILRKDDEEKRLRETIKQNEESIAKQDDVISKMRKSLETANANVQQHQAGMDELTSQKVAAEENAKKFKKERNTARSWNYVLAATVIIITVLWILL